MIKALHPRFESRQNLIMISALFVTWYNRPPHILSIFYTKLEICGIHPTGVVAADSTGDAVRRGLTGRQDCSKAGAAGTADTTAGATKLAKEDVAGALIASVPHRPEGLVEGRGHDSVFEDDLSVC